MARPSTKNKPVDQKTQQKRYYVGDHQIDHDLYKLKVASFQKNTALDGYPPQYQDVEHCHFFHTVNSKGTAQNYCSAVGGHFHKMEVQYNGQDSAPTVICGPPMRRVIKTFKDPRQGIKRKRIEFAPVENQRDIHTHEVEYIRSEKMQARKMNKEFAKVQATIATQQVSSADLGLNKDFIENK